MRTAKKVSFVVVLALALASLAMPAQAWYLCGASVTPAVVTPAGGEVEVCFTLGDDSSATNKPYVVEAWFGPKDASEFFKCGLVFDYCDDVIYHSAGIIFPPDWPNRMDDLNTAGMEPIYANASWPNGVDAGTQYCFPATLPGGLEEDQTYYIHLVVGYDGECDNWTHYTLPLTVIGGGEPVYDCGITGTNALIGNWQDNTLEVTQPIGGVFYWVQFTTGTQEDSWSVEVNDPTPAGFNLQKSGSAVQVYYDGVAVQNVSGKDFTGTWMSPGTIPAGTTVTLRVHYKWDKKIGTVPDTYTFGAYISDSDGEVTFECERELQLIE